MSSLSSLSRGGGFHYSTTSKSVAFLELAVLLAAFALTASFNHVCPPVVGSVVPGLVGLS